MSLLALFGCQRKVADPDPPAMVEIRDKAGVVIAQLRPGHPCRATIGPVELIVGGPPLIAQNGETRWTGSADGHGTTLARDGAPAARIFGGAEAAAASHLEVDDPHGVAWVRISTLHGTTRVFDAGGRLLREATPGGQAIALGDSTATGTTDAELVALLGAPEIPPEIRMLAACDRVLEGS